MTIPSCAGASKDSSRPTSKGRVQIAISTIAIARGLGGPVQHGKDVLAKRYETALGGFEVVPVSRTSP
jgi:hypothetical protein